jgi:hypothetical protein
MFTSSASILPLTRNTTQSSPLTSRSILQLIVSSQAQAVPIYDASRIVLRRNPHFTFSSRRRHMVSAPGALELQATHHFVIA